jgi:hypothetical protein
MEEPYLNTNKTFPKTETPTEFSDAYHKARRQLTLYSAILIAWEYVGIRLGSKDLDPIIVKVPIAETKVRIEHPEVIPIIILLLIIYFIIRFTIEWHQNDIERRKRKVSRIDFYLSNSLAVFAIILFIFQNLSNFRLANIVTISAVSSLIFGLGGALFFIFIRYLPVTRKIVDSVIKFIVQFVAIRRTYRYYIYFFTLLLYMVVVGFSAMISKFSELIYPLVDLKYTGAFDTGWYIGVFSGSLFVALYYYRILARDAEKWFNELQSKISKYR